MLSLNWHRHFATQKKIKENMVGKNKSFPFYNDDVIGSLETCLTFIIGLPSYLEHYLKIIQ